MADTRERTDTGEPLPARPIPPEGESAPPFVWDDEAVRAALGITQIREGGARRYRGISTDTRTLQPGDLFVALVGPNHDGHAFLEEAESGGAAGAVVSRDVGEATSSGEMARYLVADTLVALGDLARYRRRRHAGVVMGVTGSSGKTTAKDLIRDVLALHYRVHATEANRNNRVGVPLTLLDAPAEAQVLVVEMGTNERGEIGELARIAEPQVGVLTTVSESHLEGLSSLDGVLEEKLALLRALPPEGWAVVGDEPPFLAERVRELPVSLRLTGLSEWADPEWRGRLGDPDEDGRWRVALDGVEFRCGLPGRHGVRNALLALAVGELLGVPLEEGVQPVEQAGPRSLRGEIRRLGELSVVVDCYNANPQSVRAALDLLSDLPAPGGRVAVLGSMLELGEAGPELHARILEEVRGLPVRLLVGVGAFADALRMEESPGNGGPERVPADSLDEAWAILDARLTGSETVLLKASRGVALERLLPRIEERFSTRGGD